MTFDPKVSALKEREYLGTLSMDGLYGIFTSYEMRTKQENPIVKEEAFKASNKKKKKTNKNSKPCCNRSDDSDEDE